ncbi:MurR/RpiR family transcriptional regulator [Sinorhizobium americanum]|uniref:MurR/RpiR family transcriptional regulator n=1 Tax=Sinorhizobium americanum TaxID=194963 RepID=UPI000933DE6A|nr:MurR/RpiR family transcriptional regulator [Sinorhizobium americanum]
MQEPQNKKPPLLDMIHDAIDSAPRALARIALYITRNPELILTLSIAEIARNTETGPATAVRFCRTLGYSGFREFKIALSGEIERGRVFEGHCGALQGASIAPRIAVLSSALQNSIAASARMLDDTQVKDLAKRVRTAQRIEVFGMGLSSACANILALRLIWLGFPVHSPSSAGISHGLARTLNSSSIAIGISSSGVTEETKEFLATARKTGAHTVAITTRVDCPVARHADELLQITSAGAWGAPGSSMHIPAVVLLSEYLCRCLQD